MSKNRQKPAPRTTQFDEFFRESRRAFGEQYKATWDPSILMAQRTLDDSVDRGMLTPAEGLSNLREPALFANLILKAEQKYQEREDQRVHDRMANLERNTDWKAAAVVSLGAGMVTGIVFALASPFITTWLQPTADELFKRAPAAQTSVTPPQLTQNITNIYNHA